MSVICGQAMVKPILKRHFVESVFVDIVVISVSESKELQERSEKAATYIIRGQVA